MALQIDNGKTTSLPFELVLTNKITNDLKNGTYINQLVSSPTSIEKCMYEVTELRDIYIHLITNEPIELTVCWSKISQHENDESFIKCKLDKETLSYCLYKHEHNGNGYLWSVGQYHFEVIYEHKTYYGGFKVVPKNVSEEGYIALHQTISRHLEGLVVDYLKYKKTWGILNYIQDTTYWRVWEWYQKIESVLLNNLTSIELYSAQGIVRKYKLDERPKRLDQKSMQWEQSIKGVAYNGSKYLNCKMTNYEDIEENHAVKYFISKIILKLDETHSFFEKVIEDIEGKITESQIDLNNKRGRFEQVKTNVRSTKNIIRKYSTQVDVIEKRIKMLQKNSSNYNQTNEKLKLCKKNLESKINTPFWANIKTKVPNRIIVGSNNSYKVIYKIFKESQSLLYDGGDLNIVLPVYKSTDLLYEYFVLFSIVDLFIKYNFISNEESLSEQIQNTFFRDGLEDATKITLVKDTYMVQIVYNEELEINDLDAERKGSNFFTKKENRKPDIRLDLFILDGTNNWTFDSSIVIEIKYSPLNNIYSRNGETKATEQMDNYLDIRRVNVINGKRCDNNPFILHPVKFVICLYSGESNFKNENNLIQAACGKFIRYFPYSDSNIFGVELLEKEIFENWLKFNEESNEAFYNL